jgi:hypothetical protein
VGWYLIWETFQMLAIRPRVQGNPFVKYEELVDICMFFSRNSYPGYKSDPPRAFQAFLLPSGHS